MMQISQRVAHERLSRICHIDYDREMALIAEWHDPDEDHDLVVGVGRLTKELGTNEAEFAMVVVDEFQREGIGTELLRRLVQVGKDEGLDRITADILVQNRAMQHVSEKLGFEIVHSGEMGDEMVKAVKTIE
jgi:acetyltransferase